MGRKNNALTWYMNRDVIMADFMNGALYGGEKVIALEELAEIQRTYQENMYSRNGRKRRTLRERDVARAYCKKGHMIILAVENQNMPNLCMPLRNLEYDVEDFVRQLRRLRRRYQEKGGLKGEIEYLSGIRKTDRLIPVVTLVFYHGKEKWDGPLQLQDMLDMEEMDQTLKALHMDYRLCVIHLSDLEEKNFETGLRELIGLMKRRDDKKAMQIFCRENESRFRKMDDETYDVICAMISQELQLKKEKCRDQGKETVDMCRAIDEMVKDGEIRGERRGEKRGEEKMSRLISCLCKEGRTEDIGRAADNIQVRRRLYREYGI